MTDNLLQRLDAAQDDPSLIYGDAALVEAADDLCSRLHTSTGTGRMTPALEDAVRRLNIALAALDASRSADPDTKPGCCQSDGGNANG